MATAEEAREEKAPVARAEDGARPFQFTLRQLAIFMLVVAVAVVLITRWRFLGLIICYAAACFGVMGWSAYRDNKWFLAGLFGLIGGFCTFALITPSLGVPTSVARQLACRHNLHTIAIALQNYHDAYGSFPPAYIADANGKPIHSWRVLILPFTEQASLYHRYRFDEPWDGPNNRKLHGVAIKLFGCPESCSIRGPHSRVETNYVAVIGPQTMWPGERATKMSDIKDGSSNTLMVVEVHNSGIHWMEPRDLHVVQMPLAINSPKGQGISSLHLRGAEAVFVDGHVETLTNNTPAEVLRALLTIDGGETIPEF